MKDDQIADKLGLQPMDSFKSSGNIVEHRTTEIVNSTAQKNLDSDRDYARANFYDVIETGSRALQDMIEVAGQSQHPRAYEVVATLMKALTDANKDLVDMSEKRVPKEEQAAPQEVNNNLIFNGSTKDLLEMLKKKNDE